MPVAIDTSVLISAVWPGNLMRHGPYAADFRLRYFSNQSNVCWLTSSVCSCRPWLPDSKKIRRNGGLG